MLELDRLEGQRAARLESHLLGRQGAHIRPRQHRCDRTASGKSKGPDEVLHFGLNRDELRRFYTFAVSNLIGGQAALWKEKNLAAKGSRRGQMTGAAAAAECL